MLRSLTLFVVFMVMLSLPGRSQYNIDSLDAAISSMPDDTQKVKVIYNVCINRMNGDVKRAEELAKLEGEVARKIKWPEGISWSYMHLSSIYMRTGRRDEALAEIKEGIVHCDKHDLLNIKANLISNRGTILINDGDLEAGMDEYVASLKVFEELKDTFNIGRMHSNIGVLFSDMGDFKKAIERYQLSMDMAEASGDTRKMAIALVNMGNAYENLDDIDGALEHYKRSLELFKQVNEQRGVGLCLSNLGGLLINEGKFDEAIIYLKEGLALRRAAQSLEGMSESMRNLGLAYVNKGEHRTGFVYLDSALTLARDNRYKQQELTALHDLSDAYKVTGDFKNALEYKDAYITLRDSMINEEKIKQIGDLEAKYQNEKQELEIEALKNKEAAQQAEVDRKNALNLAYGIGFVLVAILLIFVLRGYAQKKKANLVLEEKNDEITLQKLIVEEKNQEITDSITYAKRIQEAILPPTRLVKEWLPDSFVLYKPKDIVAGDFYWMEQANNKIYFAAADCTGHGVPGAMVSVVCHNALNRALKEFQLTDPGQILDKVRELVEETFEQSEQDVKDGMDIALCILDTESRTIMYSGANNPLWIIRSGAHEVEQFKADKQPIGKFADAHPFTSHQVSLNPGDIVYVFSDGYADQFGGPRGKKFKYKAFRDLLLENKDKPMEEQRAIIDQQFEEWRGELEQIDDVCVIGVRV